jgi:pimeloyl-ACP methyl ester carboxylesterase
VQLTRLIGRTPKLARMPRGRGGPVLVLPGRGVDDRSTLPLRSFLQLLGHAPTGWGLGANDGDLPRLIPLAAERASDLAASSGRPVALVGQSMGGAIAREVARRWPAAVRRVITLGSPILAPTSPQPIVCPLTVVFSRDDRIVPPRWALVGGDEAEIVEVRSTHFSMGLDPDVWTVIAHRLAEGDDAGAR